MFQYKRTDIFDKATLDLEPVKKDGILQKDENNNQRYLIKFTILDGTQTKYKYLSVTDKGVLIARDDDGYEEEDASGKTKHYNEFLIIPNNKSNLDQDLLKKLDYVGITSELTATTTTNKDSSITNTPIETTNTDTATTDTTTTDTATTDTTTTDTATTDITLTDTVTTSSKIEYEYEKINELLGTNILKRDLLKNYINKVYLNKVNYNGKLEIYLNKRNIRKDILKINDDKYFDNYEQLYPDEPINLTKGTPKYNTKKTQLILKEELIKLETIVKENNMEDDLKITYK